ncbi:histidine kinase [Streptomyces roseicoloratus]|uniref:histidine kinase n=1 Tax=Streptomyces roseicoloratus TaxID=2508722 RepID=A0ABY9RWT4_9ACTN|nr:histidine kinase [Streptomyces roseicoloratus]WMX46647.1 histidine kinase [Streptomyces roseicoloratus]
MTTTGADRGAVGAGSAGRSWWWWGRRRGVVLDVSLAVVSALECGLEGVGFAQEASLPVPVGVLFGLVVGSVLLVRRKWPITVVLVSIAVTPAEMGFLMGIVGLYSLAASEVPRRFTAGLAGMSTVAVYIVTMVRLRQDVAQADVDQQDFDPSGWYVPVVSLFMTLGFNAPPVLFGLYIGARRRLMESLRERADSLEQELSLLADRAEQRAQWARQEERRRIAREMHDVVAHRVSLMVVHAAALQAVALKDPQKAVKNAALVGDMGRQALSELREMLGVLREEVPAVVPVAGLASVVPLAAVGRAAAAAAEAAAEGGDGGDGGRQGGAGGDGPCLDALEALVEQSRQAGAVVELLVTGEARPYGAEVEQTAYRVVQEALTNVHKHAAGARVVVRLAHREAEVAMQVENGPSDATVADADLPSGGNGLVGMRERVTRLGGVFVSGPTEAGGFRVSAVLPVREAAAAAS